MKYKQGDILIIDEHGGKVKILGISGDAIFLSQKDEFRKAQTRIYTCEELLQYDYQIEEQPWEPKDKEMYWFINSKQTVVSAPWVNKNVVCEKRKNFLGVFPTKEKVEEALVEIKRKLNLK